MQLSIERMERPALDRCDGQSVSCGYSKRGQHLYLNLFNTDGRNVVLAKCFPSAKGQVPLTSQLGMSCVREGVVDNYCSILKTHQLPSGIRIGMVKEDE
ncbi:hypothetical protein AVEN_76708-1 [Araneus ventricosus]|uniref:Uncharacterized protein n=1 Tax=Araneus ventricosus TaxID=182803 RepID=A0A4Y2BP57_ARAVE|nr:hypothetical protein AVEN_76708-1 [Araneus ventricosus]